MRRLARGPRRGSQLAAAVATLGAWLLAVDLYLFYLDYTGEPVKTEFLLYYIGGWICRVDGCGRLYDLGLQRPLLEMLRHGIPTDYWVNFVNPPPLAWLMAPLSLLPVLWGQWLWLGFMTISLIAALIAVSPWRGLARIAAGLLVLGLFPVDFAARIEQVDVALAGGVGLAWWLLRRRRDVGAGAVIAALVAVKPFLFFLVVPALLLAGRRQAFLASLVAGGLLFAVSALQLGPAGIHQYLATSALSTNRPTSWALTLRYFFGPGWGGTVAAVAAAAAALWGIHRRRGEGIDIALPAAILGSFLASPYLHDYDAPVLAVAALIWLRANPGPVQLAFFLGGAAATEATLLTPIPFLVFELVWLALLLRGTGLRQANAPLTAT
ncbi:MAG TPA: glycosyltransferase family 87 protein [Candidatus Dormibacteraeota bacterium]